MTRYTDPSSPSYEPGPVQSGPGQLRPGQPGYDQPRGSTTAVAQEQAAAVGQSAAGAGARVTQTATDQAREVVSETARQARDLLGEAGGQVRDQSSVQQQKAASQLHSVADELHEMAAKGGQSGLATEVAQQTAERLHGAASWLEQREPADVLQAVRNFARRRPGMFLAGAVAAGLVAGRLTRGMTDAARSGNQGNGTQGYGDQGYGTQGYGAQGYGTRRPSQQVPSGAAIPPPPGPGLATPAPGYPADVVPEGGTGTVTPGAAPAEPYYPAAGVPGPGAAGMGAAGTGATGSPEEITPGLFRDSGDPDDPPETYRPGSRP